MRKIWPFTFYFWQFAGVAAMMPFIVLYYQKLGFSGGQIGFLAGLSPLLTLLGAPLLTRIADVTHRHRLVISIALLGSSLGIFALPFLKTFVPILIGLVFTSIMLSPVSPLADSATMNMLGEEKGKYGRLRLGGTIGFAMAAPLAGKLAQQFGLETTFRASAFLFILAFFASRQFVQVLEKLPPKSKENQASGSEFLWKNPRWLIFLAAALGGGFAMAFSNNYFFPYMKELGAGESIMGLALTLGTICEVPVMFFGNWLLGTFKPYRLFILSLVITGARLVLFSFAGNPTQALFIQALSGLTFPAMWLAGVAYVDENAPAGMSATAQGIFGAVVFGVGTALGGFIGGSILESLGARSMSLIFGSITLAIVALVLLSGSLVSRRQTEKAVI